MSKCIKQKIGRVTKSLATTGLILCGSIMMRELAYGAGTVVTLTFLDDLGATVVNAMKGAGSLVIDAIIIAGGGFASARASSPVPVLFALGSAGLFELFVKLLIK